MILKKDSYQKGREQFETHAPSLLILTEKDCPHCDRAKKILAALEIEDLPLGWEASITDEPELVGRLSLVGVPMVMVRSAKGRELRFVGFPGEEKLLESLRD